MIVCASLRRPLYAEVEALASGPSTSSWTEDAEHFFQEVVTPVVSGFLRLPAALYTVNHTETLAAGTTEGTFKSEGSRSWEKTKWSMPLVSYY